MQCPAPGVSRGVRKQELLAYSPGWRAAGILSHSLHAGDRAQSQQTPEWPRTRVRRSHPDGECGAVRKASEITGVRVVRLSQLPDFRLKNIQEFEHQLQLPLSALENKIGAMRPFSVAD